MNKVNLILEGLHQDRVLEGKGSFENLASYFKKLNYPEGIVFTDNGYYDLEKEGISGKGVWVGFKHTSSGASNNKLKKTLKSVISDVENDMKKYIKSEGIKDAGEVKVNDFMNSSDMYRVYFTIG